MQTYYNKALSCVKTEFVIKSKGSYPTTSLFVSSFNGCQTSKLGFCIKQSGKVVQKNLLKNSYAIELYKKK
jgi:hypothetical protein